MQSLIWVTLVAGAFVLNGCAIRPQPEDYARVSAYEIVRRIRCEMRDAIRAHVIYQIADKQSKETAAAMASDEVYRSYTKNPKGHIDDQLQSGIAFYYPTIVTYAFEFQITENNNASVSATFQDPTSAGLFKLGLGLGADRERQNRKVFRITDTFGDLSMNISDIKDITKPDRIGYCFPQAYKHANYLYPITGRLGLDDLVSEFLDLNQSGNLGPPDEGKTLPTTVNTLKFTTVLKTNADPNLDLPSGQRFDLVSVGGKLSVQRSDIHQVSIVMALPRDSKDGKTVAQRRIEEELNKEEERNQADRLVDRLNRL